nr:hypothetical protein HmN_000850400 [Hymenolepis microstoma]
MFRDPFSNQGDGRGAGLLRSLEMNRNLFTLLRGRKYLVCHYLCDRFNGTVLRLKNSCERCCHSVSSFKKRELTLKPLDSQESRYVLSYISTVTHLEERKTTLPTVDSTAPTADDDLVKVTVETA